MQNVALYRVVGSGDPRLYRYPIKLMLFTVRFSGSTMTPQLEHLAKKTLEASMNDFRPACSLGSTLAAAAEENRPKFI